MIKVIEGHSTNSSESTRGFYECKFNMSLIGPILFPSWLISVFSGFPLLPSPSSVMSFLVYNALLLNSRHQGFPWFPADFNYWEGEEKKENGIFTLWICYTLSQPYLFLRFWIILYRYNFRKKIGTWNVSSCECVQRSFNRCERLFQRHSLFSSPPCDTAYC